VSHPSQWRFGLPRCGNCRYRFDNLANSRYAGFLLLIKTVSRDIGINSMNQFKNILVQVDTRRDEQALLHRAIELAKVHGATLKIVDIVPEFSWPLRWAATDYDEIRQAVIHQKEELVEALIAPLRNFGVEVTSKVLCGKSSDQIIGEVVRSKHDLVMKDAKGQFSPHPGTFGTTAMRLVRYCPCPVWAYRPKHSTGPEKVVAAVDATATDEAHMALNHDIMSWAKAVSGDNPPHVAHVWSVYGEAVIKDYMKRDEFEDLVRDAEHEAREQIGKLLAPHQMSASDANVHLLRGDPAPELIRLVNNGGCDLLVLGTVARTGITGLLIGNTAETLINRVECSVLAIKPADFVTPIHAA
jgi:universal stress protein E